MKGASLFVALCLICGIIGLNMVARASLEDGAVTSERSQFWSTTMVAGAGGITVTGAMILGALGLGGLAGIPVIGTIITAVLGVIGTLGSAVFGFPILAGGAVLVVIVIGIILAILGPIGVGLATLLSGGAAVSIMGLAGTVISALSGPIIGLLGLLLLPVILAVTSIPSILSIISAILGGVFTCLTGGGLTVAFGLIVNGIFTGIAGLPILGQLLNLCLVCVYPLLAVFNTICAMVVNVLSPFITPIINIISIVCAPCINIIELVCGPVITAILGPVGRLTVGV